MRNQKLLPTVHASSLLDSPHWHCHAATIPCAMLLNYSTVLVLRVCTDSEHLICFHLRIHRPGKKKEMT